MEEDVGWKRGEREEKRVLLRHKEGGERHNHPHSLISHQPLSIP